MKRSIKLSTLHGMIIKMHPTFLILLVWVVSASAVNVLTIDQISWSLILFGLVFSSVLTDELTHYMVARQFKTNSSEITLCPTVGITMQEAMGKLMGNQAKHFMVMNSGKPIGTIHRIKIINKAAEKNYDLPVKSLMKENLVFLTQMIELRI